MYVVNNLPRDSLSSTANANVKFLTKLLILLLRKTPVPASTQVYLPVTAFLRAWLQGQLAGSLIHSSLKLYWILGLKTRCCWVFSITVGSVSKLLWDIFPSPRALREGRTVLIHSWEFSYLMNSLAFKRRRKKKVWEGVQCSFWMDPKGLLFATTGVFTAVMRLCREEPSICHHPSLQALWLMQWVQKYVSYL